MSFKVGFTIGALRDVREAQAWYEKKVPGLGARFSEAVERQSRALETMPEKYRVARADIHLCSVPKFPFELYYRIIRTTGDNSCGACRKTRPRYTVRKIQEIVFKLISL